MELPPKIDLEDYGIREYPDTGTILMFKRGMDGEPDYAVEGEGFVMEFKDGMVYTIDIYEPDIAKKFKGRYLLSVK